MSKRATYPRKGNKPKVRWGRIVFVLSSLCLGVFFLVREADVSTLDVSTRDHMLGGSESAMGEEPGTALGDPSSRQVSAAGTKPQPGTGEKHSASLPPSASLAGQAGEKIPQAQGSSDTAVISGQPLQTIGESKSAADMSVKDTQPEPVWLGVNPATAKMPFVIAGKDPFPGKSLEQVTAQLATNRFIGHLPAEWDENLPGITTHLSHVWEEKMVSKTGQFEITAQSTAVPSKTGLMTVALTLDACGGKSGASLDLELLEFLEKEEIPATIFVTTKWLKSNPENFKRIAQNPLFEIGAHGTHHKPASINGRSVYGQKGTSSLAALVLEVEGNVRDIERLSGRRPRWFRSGTAFYDEVALAVISRLNLGIAGYSLTADEGATLSARKVAAKTLAAKNGDIILAHINHPEAGTGKGLIQALSQMKVDNVQFVTLSPRK